MSDIISVDSIRNGFLVDDHNDFSGPKYVETTGDMIFAVLKGLFDRYYYMVDDNGTPSEEWYNIIAGVERFETQERAFVAKWKEDADRIAKEFAEDSDAAADNFAIRKQAAATPTKVITEEGVQDI